MIMQPIKPVSTGRLELTPSADPSFTGSCCKEVNQLEHFSSLTFALLFNHIQPNMHSDMDHIPTLKADRLAYVFLVHACRRD